MDVAKIIHSIRANIAPRYKFGLIADERDVNDPMLGVCILVGVSRQYQIHRDAVKEYVGISDEQYDEELEKFLSYLGDRGKGDDFDKAQEEFHRKYQLILNGLYADLKFKV